MMGERKVREGRVVRRWGVVKGWGWDEKGKGFRMEGLRMIEKKDLESMKG